MHLLVQIFNPKKEPQSNKIESGDLNGYLQKKGDDWIGWWRQRWFVLQKSRILYYPDKENNPQIKVSWPQFLFRFFIKDAYDWERFCKKKKKKNSLMKQSKYAEGNQN